MAWARALGGLILCAVCGALWTLLSILRDSRPGNLLAAEPIVIFGARVGPAGPSQAMRARVDRAAELASKRPAPSLVCCGTRQEIEEMRVLLEERGTTGGAILDCFAASTREAIKALRRMPSTGSGPIAAVSSPYHMHRIRVEAGRSDLGVVCVPSRVRGGPHGRFSVAGMRSLARLHFRELLASWWYALTSPGRAITRRETPAR